MQNVHRTVTTTVTDANPKAAWPDLSVDQRAWELAKVACGPDAILSDVVQRAQEIKKTLSEKAI